MSETTIPFVCYYCGQATTNANDVLPRFEEGNGFECVSQDACERRQKRDQIAAGRHFSAMFNPISIVRAFGLINVLISAIIVVCAVFLIATAFACLSFLWGF
jgi:hypothetical protein